MSTALPDQARAIDDCWNRIGVWGSGDCVELPRRVHCRNCPVYSAAAAKLLDGELPANYRDEWRNYFARPKGGETGATASVVLFRLQSEWLGISTAIVREVAGLRPIHSLPHRRDRMVRGIANIRGELHICISLMEVIGIEPQPEGAKPAERAAYGRLLVAEREGFRLVFPVDEVHGIRRFDMRELQPAPATVSRASVKFTKGLFTWEEHSVGWLDDAFLFLTLNRSLG